MRNLCVIYCPACEMQRCLSRGVWDVPREVLWETHGRRWTGIILEREERLACLVRALILEIQRASSATSLTVL